MPLSPTPPDWAAENRWVAPPREQQACSRPAESAPGPQAKTGIITLTKHVQGLVSTAVACEKSAGAPEVIELEARQIARGREALRDWLASGKDGLTVTNRSLDKAVVELVSALFLREARVCAASSA